MSFLRFVARRLVLMIGVLIGVTVMTFFLSHVVPADPVAAYLGEHASEEAVAKMRHDLGLDKPLPEQYFIYMRNLIHGDLGVSIRNNRPVSDDLRDYLPATVELSTAAIIAAVIIGIPTGVISAVYRNRWEDQTARGFSLVGVSLPVFYLGLLILALFYYKLGWFPGRGQLSPFVSAPQRITGLLLVDSLLEGNMTAFVDAVRHLVLPAVCLGFASAGVITRMTRASMLEVLNQDYIRTARAKGLSERVVNMRHALRNAMIPTVTIIGLAYGSLLSGAVLTETIFSWPGIGRYATDSVTSLDIPAILGVTLVSAVIYSLANLAVDIAYAYLDPRIRY